MKRLLEFSAVLIGFGLFGLMISNIQDERTFKKLYYNATIITKGINITRRNILVRSDTNLCHSGEEEYKCDDMIKWGKVGGCYDPVNVSCLGYYYWMDNYGYQQTIFYPEGERNFKGRSTIMEKSVWDLELEYQTGRGVSFTYNQTCYNWSCVLDWNHTKHHHVIIDRKTGEMVDIKEYRSRITIFFTMIIYSSFLGGLAFLLQNA